MSLAQFKNKPGSGDGQFDPTPTTCFVILLSILSIILVIAFCA